MNGFSALWPRLTNLTKGLRYAILIARSYGARLSVLTCYDGKLPDDETADAMRAGVKRAIEHSFVSSPGLADAVRLEWDLTVVTSSRPAEAINREAVSRNADLIVMGTDGATTIDDFKLERLLVATDFSSNSEVALREHHS